MRELRQFVECLVELFGAEFLAAGVRKLDGFLWQSRGICRHIHAACGGLGGEFGLNVGLEFWSLDRALWVQYTPVSTSLAGTLRS
jgi:hypothetical protein